MEGRQSRHELDIATQAEFILFDQDLEDRYAEAFQENDLDGRCLTEVDHINRFIRPDGTCSKEVLEAVNTNLLTAVKEAAMPYAVSTTHQEYRDGTFWWLDQTPSDVAKSGYKFHRHPAAIRRVDVEVEEAYDVEKNLRPGFIKVLISPKMSEADAPLEVARREHLGDDDMIRIHMLNSDDEGNIKGKFMQSVLVRDIPLRAWVKMFEDPGNIFGRSFEVRDPDSALSIMELHKELELPESALPEGTVTLIEAVLPYLSLEERRNVESQLLLFRGNQEDIHKKAESIAARWLGFEAELAQSLRQKKATLEVERFVYSLQHEWGDKTLNLLESLRLEDGGFEVNRKLAAQIERAKQKTLWVSAAVVTHNQKVINQMDSQTVKHIYDNEMAIQQMSYRGVEYRDIVARENSNNQVIARQEVQVGGGCPGDNDADLGGSNGDSGDSGVSTSGSKDIVATNANNSGREKKKGWKWKSGVCRIAECPSRPRSTLVGPCAVCTCCQRIFDCGGNPSVVYGRKPAENPPLAEQKAVEAKKSEAEDPDFAAELETMLDEEYKVEAVGNLAVANA